jgi:Transposase DDE domain group 1
MSPAAERVVAFYNKRGTCEQWIKEGKGAIKWTRLSCRTFAANAVRLQLHALAYNLGNFLRTLATPEPIKDWSLTSLKEKLIKIGAKVVSHGRYVAPPFGAPTVAAVVRAASPYCENAEKRNNPRRLGVHLGIPVHSITSSARARSVEKTWEVEYGNPGNLTFR